MDGANVTIRCGAVGIVTETPASSVIVKGKAGGRAVVAEGDPAPPAGDAGRPQLLRMIATTASAASGADRPRGPVPVSIGSSLPVAAVPLNDEGLRPAEA